MNTFISAEHYALAHYYLAQVQKVPLPDELLDSLRKKALLHMPEDRASLLRRQGLQFCEDDFTEEIKEIAHVITKDMKKKLTT